MYENYNKKPELRFIHFMIYKCKVLHYFSKLFPEWIETRSNLDEDFYAQIIHCVHLLVILDNKYKIFIKKQKLFLGLKQYQKLSSSVCTRNIYQMINNIMLSGNVRNYNSFDLELFVRMGAMML